MTGSWTQSFFLYQLHKGNMVCLAISSYSFNILQDVYTHNGGVHVHRILIFIKYLIMTGSWNQSFFYAPVMRSRGGGILVKYSQNDRQLDFISFLWSGGGIICVLQTHFIFKKITPNKTTLSIIIKCGGILLFQFSLNFHFSF